jgi:probable rRNA maturation factor
VSVIFCSDSFLLAINQQYLQHDYYTDIVTFDQEESGKVSGDLIISIDRVKENATTLECAFQDELHRVIIHGILHLCGHKDKTRRDAAKMRSLENLYLALRNSTLVNQGNRDT